MQSVSERSGNDCAISSQRGEEPLYLLRSSFRRVVSSAVQGEAACTSSDPPTPTSFSSTSAFIFFWGDAFEGIGTGMGWVFGWISGRGAAGGAAAGGERGRVGGVAPIPVIIRTGLVPGGGVCSGGRSAPNGFSTLTGLGAEGSEAGTCSVFSSVCIAFISTLSLQISTFVSALVSGADWLTYNSSLGTSMPSLVFSISFGISSFFSSDGGTDVGVTSGTGTFSSPTGTRAVYFARASSATFLHFSSGPSVVSGAGLFLGLTIVSVGGVSFIIDIYTGDYKIKQRLSRE
mmetsp:Transcript_4858/g.10288  ORF Transcript_4858/g.10288 Transcript_4858/m.10288 type:complete len:289 (-) Transcript_4858:372-1238(-)